MDNYNRNSGFYPIEMLIFMVKNKKRVPHLRLPAGWALAVIGPVGTLILCELSKADLRKNHGEKMLKPWDFVRFF